MFTTFSIWETEYLKSVNWLCYKKHLCCSKSGVDLSHLKILELLSCIEKAIDSLFKRSWHSNYIIFDIYVLWLLTTWESQMSYLKGRIVWSKSRSTKVFCLLTYKIIMRAHKNSELYCSCWVLNLFIVSNKIR